MIFSPIGQYKPFVKARPKVPKYAACFARFGKIVSADLTGVFPKTLEAKMMLGRNSSKSPIWTSVMNENPWSFSGVKSDEDAIQPYVNSQEEVWVEFDMPQAVNMIYPRYDSFFMFQRLGKIAGTNPVILPEDHDCTGDDRPGLKAEKSYFSGHLVSVAEQGMFFDSREAIIQLGSQGNTFVSFSILDKPVYDCAVKYLKAGVPVQLEYSESYLLRNPLMRQDPKVVWRISPAGSPTTAKPGVLPAADAKPAATTK